MLEGLFGKRKSRSSEPVKLPEAMKAEDPVNYNSVLDYLVGLSVEDFKKMTKSAEIYRKANKDVANLLEVEDEPTTAIKTEKPEISDDEMDDMLNADPEALQAAFLDDAPGQDKPKKPQASEKKVEVKEQ